jgi:hypothetical protein
MEFFYSPAPPVLIFLMKYVKPTFSAKWQNAIKVSNLLFVVDLDLGILAVTCYSKKFCLTTHELTEDGC